MGHSVVETSMFTISRNRICESLCGTTSPVWFSAESYNSARVLSDIHNSSVSTSNADVYSTLVPKTNTNIILYCVSMLTSIWALYVALSHYQYILRCGFLLSELSNFNKLALYKNAIKLGNPFNIKMSPWWTKIFIWQIRWFHVSIPELYWNVARNSWSSLDFISLRFPSWYCHRLSWYLYSKFRSSTPNHLQKTSKQNGNYEKLFNGND